MTRINFLMQMKNILPSVKSASSAVFSCQMLNRIAVMCLALSVAGISSAVAQEATAGATPQFWKWAQTPPMGWNSWDCFGAAVNKAQVKENADYMADKLASHGWQYMVVDIQWYEPQAKGFNYRKNAKLEMDEYGRLLPAPTRFPSAAGGAGFKPLAEYVHSKGLKFGIHLLRGIPRQAVEANTPILGTDYHAADIADKDHPCKWNSDMWGVDMSRPVRSITIPSSSSSLHGMSIL